MKYWTILLLSGGLSKICCLKHYSLQDIRKFYGEVFDVHVFPWGVRHASATFEFFCQIPNRFTSSFVNPSFQYLSGSHIMYWNMTIILNPSGFKVEPHSKYWYFYIERWDLLSLRFSENAVLFHIEWVCRKTAGNVSRPPYRYTAVTSWACPPSSACFWTLKGAPKVSLWSLGNLVQYINS